MKRYAYVTILGFFALCSQAFATSLLPTPNVNTQGQNQNISNDTRANAAAMSSASATSLSSSTSGSAAVNTTSVIQGAATLNAGASNSAATNGGQSITFNAPSEVSTKASGTTEVRTVATVVAPDMVTTANCIIGASGGATGLGWGFAIGSGIEDKNCTRRENARLLKNLGKAEAAVRIMCNDPEVAAALGADCPPVVQPLPAQ